MNFPEVHSHKWAITFAKAKKHAEQANLLYEQGKIDEAKAALSRMYNGELEDENNIFPGLKIAGAYWRAVEGEMNLRFEVLFEYSDWPDVQETGEYQEGVERYFRLFLEDVKEIVESRGLLPYSKLEPYTTNFDTLKLGDGWVELYNNLCAETEKALEVGYMPPELLEAWFVYCLRGIVAYDYGLIRQGILSRMLIEHRGFDALKKVVDVSADDFGWRVSRLFFAEIYPKAGIEGMMLRQLGRYGMFADQNLKTSEVRPPEDDEETPIRKTTEFFNCEERGIFEPISKDSGIPLSQLGLGVCIYCADHARKNTQIFVPPDQRPELKMVRALGLGDESCLFVTEIFPEPDMERFMDAQDQVFYHDAS